MRFEAQGTRSQGRRERAVGPAVAGEDGFMLLGLIVAIAIILLVMGIFYLWVYVRRCSADAALESAKEA